MQGAQVQSLVGELSFHMLGSTALPSTKEKKKEEEEERKEKENGQEVIGCLGIEVRHKDTQVSTVLTEGFSR